MPRGRQYQDGGSGRLSGREESWWYERRNQASISGDSEECEAHQTSGGRNRDIMWYQAEESGRRKQTQQTEQRRGRRFQMRA